MYLRMCDVCGKHEKMTGCLLFDNVVPRTFVVKNYKNEDIKIFINIACEDKRDSDMLDEFAESSGDQKIKSIITGKTDLTNNFPSICEACKSELLKRSIKESVLELIRDTKTGNYVPKNKNHLETMMEIKMLIDDMFENMVPNGNKLFGEDECEL